MRNYCWLILLSIGGLLVVAACDKPWPVIARETATLQGEKQCQPDGVCQLLKTRHGLREGRALLYYSSGQLHAILHYQHDTLEGVQRWFYENGTPKTIQTTHQGKLAGRVYEFSEEGQLLALYASNNGNNEGPYFEFYQQPRGCLRGRANFVIVDNREQPTGYVRYDTLGRVTDRWGFALVRAAHDTVALGDSLTLHLGVRYPKEPHVLAALGDFDAAFRLRDASSLRVVYGRHHQVTVRVPARQRGAHVARGYLSDYKLDPAERRAGVTGTLERQIYFAYPYYVR